MMVGCQRCGTTWVDQALREHPEVYLPPQKQTYFFDHHYDRGLDWYLEQFAGATEAHRAVGEVATGYCMSHAVPLMAESFPDIKLLMSLRNPVDRAYSFYQSRATTHGWRSFDEASEQRPDILERGRYIEQIEHLLSHYPRERLLLLFYDDLKADDRAYLRRILEFLGVDAGFRSSQIGRVTNVALFPRTRRVLNAVGLKPLLRRVSKSALGDRIRRSLKGSKIRRYKAMDPEIRQRLIEVYRPYNERLAAFAERDLDGWNR